MFLPTLLFMLWGCAGLWEPPPFPTRWGCSGKEPCPQHHQPFVSQPYSRAIEQAVPDPTLTHSASMQRCYVHGNLGSEPLYPSGSTNPGSNTNTVLPHPCQTHGKWATYGVFSTLA